MLGSDRPVSVAAFLMYLRSMLPSSLLGVPTATYAISESAFADTSSVTESAPLEIVSARYSFRLRSKNGDRAFRIFQASSL